ncbi:hypothetical protein NM688_g2471 [Phlebia brevispora]|uniref:Uncharacterized protein n=1 Tax=Phlebia brevispora TaxID=194682 RepID=A0ACC1T8E2_9APHY|nr:hypothetical protein NM688_g2471 [Phlebia brevispora]
MGIFRQFIYHILHLYGVAANHTSEIDFDTVTPDAIQLQCLPRPKGHVTAVRITAKNPDAGLKPSSGSL